MKPTAKVFEFLNSYNYYLPQNCEQVQKMFYEQMVKHLQLGDSFKNSFISQISQINQKAQRETEFRQLIRDTWLGFIENTPINNICQMLNSQEIKDVQDFILKVLLEPKRFDITYVDELLMNYESYFNSNKGLAQVVVRNRFRMTVSKLICSKFILSLDEIYQQKVRQFLFDIYLKKIEKLEQPVVIQTEFLTDSNFYFRMFEQLFDTQQDVQGTFYNLIKNVITIIVRDMSNIVFSLGIFQQFYQLYIDKDKILFEKYDQRSNVDQNKLANEILQKYKEREDLRDAIRQVVHKIFQTQNIEYKKLLKELVSKDIYNRENEQWVCQILREFDQQQRYRKPPCENDFHIYLRLQGFTLKGDKRGESEYDHPKLTLIIHDQNNTNFTVHNKLTKQTKRFDQTKEAMIILLLFNLTQAIDLTTLHLDANYLQNHTAQFKTQLQLDQQTQTKSAINTMPEDQFSDQTRMNQILYEQEERAVQKTIKIHDTPPPSPYKIKYEEIPDEQKPQTNAKLPRKKLQEETILGEPILDVISIAPIAQRHKIALLITLILILCILILMREMYFKSLHKIYREYLWKISLETMYCMFVIVVFIALYYNNYFDFWLLNYQYQQDKPNEDILLIEIKDYEENYKYNIYAYLLIGGLIIILNYLINFLQIFVFDKQMQIWQNQENKWFNKYQLVQLYKQQKDELNQKKEQQQLFNSKEIEQEIIEIQNVLLKTEECMDYLMIKLQFTYQMSPYLGPNVLDSSFNLSNYLGYISADIIYQISVWDTQQYIIFTIYFFFMIILLYFINIIIVSMLYCFILFIKIINLNYTMIMIKEKCLIKKEYDNLLEDELQVVPPFMEPIFENILPKRSVDIQTDLFPLANKRYISIVVSSLIKMSTTLLFVMNIYFYYWQPYALYVIIICNIICIATCISIIYISNNIIHHYTIVLSLYIRNYDFVYNVIKSQKQLLIQASNQFYELIRYINKKSLQHTLQKNHLLLLRPVIVDIIDLCKKYQKKGMQQAQYDPREVELVDLGIEGIDLIHKKHLKNIIYAITDKFSEQDLVYIESFCSDENAEYFSPMKLILYLHLRYQEIKMNSRQLIKEVLQKVIPMTFDIPQKLEAEIPDNYIQDGLEGYLDINVLDNFLKESVKSNFYKEEYRVILIQQLNKLKSKKLDQISNFISDQISQLPQ